MTLRSLLLIGLFFFLFSAPVPADSADKRSQKSIQKTQAAASYRPFLINAVFNYYGNNGDGSYNKFSIDNEGFEFFKGTERHLIFKDGVIWGGFLNGETTPRVGGSLYQQGIQPGPIIQPGTHTANPLAADPADRKYRIYRVRPDIRPAIPYAQVQSKIQTGEVAYISRYENYSAQDIYNQYVADWNEWPADLGAPFSYGRDAAGNLRSAPASYDPKYDIPGQPGADQTLWYVANDMDSVLTEGVFQSRPIGLEMQRTIWGYRRNGILDQVIFMSTKVVNKSGARIDSMFISQFSDPDIGSSSGDDFDGCDTLRDLGYAYNSVPVDGVYGTSIPAAGFTFLQGPVVPSPSDSAIFMQRRRPGYRNIRMSAFEGYFPIVFDDPFPNSALSVYRIMNGLVSTTGSPMLDPVTHLPTTFYAPGDPVSRTGWIDGSGGVTVQDRRMYQSVGPFTMAAGDTQEIVMANCAGVGADYLSSISVLRTMVDGLRSDYRNLYQLLPVPTAPLVNVGPLDGEVILTWGDPASISAVETTVEQGYAFEGYNVYEYASSSGLSPTPIATYDVVDGIKAIADTVYDQSTGLYLTSVVQRGTDSGVRHSIDIKRSVITNLPLSNGSPYFYAVTSYRYSAVPSAIVGSHCIESSPVIVTAVPHSANPGTRYHQVRGDTIPVTHVAVPGKTLSDGRVLPSVVDPTRLTGDTYAVTFGIDTIRRRLTWGIRNQAKNTILAGGQTNQSGDNSYPVVDGVQVTVIGPPPGMKPGDQYLSADTASWGWYIPSGSRKWSPSGSDNADSWRLEGFNRGGSSNGAIGNAFDHWFTGGVTYDRLASVLIRFAATDSTWNPAAAPADSNFSRGYRYVRNATDASTFAVHPGWSALIPNKTGGFAYQDYNYGIPFSAWNMDVSPPARLAVGHLENNAPGGFLDGKWWPPSVAMTGVDNGLTQREWWFIFDAPYTDPAPNPALTVDILHNATPMMWFGMPDRVADSYAAGDEFMIIPYRVNEPSDTFTFSTVAPASGDLAVARADVTRINVFPNPYQSFDRADPTRYTTVVTFTHLPARAIIRIFTLAGIMVKAIMKDDPGQFAAWDMRNEAGRSVAAGMYLVYIQMPDLGSTKTLKLGILAEKP